MTKIIIPDAFLPGEESREELEEREWSQVDFASILGVTPSVVNDLITGRRPIGLETASLLADAFETSAQYWLNLESAYKLALKRIKKKESVARKAKLYSKAPVGDIVKRGWIEDSSNIDTLEGNVCKLLRIPNINAKINFGHAARKSGSYTMTTPSQTAWLARGRQLTDLISVERKFDPKRFDEMIGEISTLMEEPEELRHLTNIFSRYGVKFLIVQYLPKSKIDGSCFWVDNRTTPVVMLSLRYDRIDNFWFSLMHELGHVKHGHGKSEPVIDEFGGPNSAYSDKSKEEELANSFATNELVLPSDLESFISRNSEAYSSADIYAFAMTKHRHPGIVVGQLHYRNAD